jgi:hypothetical protein
MKSKAKARSGDSDVEPESEGEHIDQPLENQSYDFDDTNNLPLLTRKRSRTLDDDDYLPSFASLPPPARQSVDDTRLKKKPRIIEVLPI